MVFISHWEITNMEKEFCLFSLDQAFLSKKYKNPSHGHKCLYYSVPSHKSVSICISCLPVVSLTMVKLENFRPSPRSLIISYQGHFTLLSASFEYTVEFTKALLSVGLRQQCPFWLDLEGQKETWSKAGSRNSTVQSSVFEFHLLYTLASITLYFPNIFKSQLYHFWQNIFLVFLWGDWSLQGHLEDISGSSPRVWSQYNHYFPEVLMRAVLKALPVPRSIFSYISANVLCYLCSLDTASCQERGAAATAVVLSGLWCW